ERWQLTRADAVVVVSTALAKHVRRLDVPAKNIHVMPNGVNPKLFCSEAQSNYAVSSKLNDSQPGAKGPTLGFIGSLRPWHGVEVLPQLISRLGRSYPNLRLIIIGDGQLRGELEREFKRRKLTKLV